MNLLERRAMMFAGKSYPHGQCGANAFWEFNTDTGLLTLSGSGAMTAFGMYGAPWYQYMSSIQNAFVSDGITSLGSGFLTRANIQTLTLPASVINFGTTTCYQTSINQILYGGILNQWLSINVNNNGDNPYGTLLINGEPLTEATISDGFTTVRINAFRNNKKINSVTISDSVTSISYNAFSDCTLSSITLSNNLISIYAEAFPRCSKLKTISFPNTLTTIGNSAFYMGSLTGTLEIPASVKSIGATAFRGCPLSAVIFKGTPNSIANNAFAYSSITNIYVPWSEGDVAGAPWGATNATIHYNYTPS